MPTYRFDPCLCTMYFCLVNSETRLIFILRVFLLFQNKIIHLFRKIKNKFIPK